MLNEGPYTKQQAINMLSILGFSEEYDIGEAGDGGYGSRYYFKRPNGRLNQFGIPLNHATVSKVMGRWWISVFDPYPESVEPAHSMTGMSAHTVIVDDLDA